MSIYDKASLVLIPSGSKTSKVYSQVPTNGDGDFTFSRSTAATRVNASGNIEKETQNLLLQSNNFDTSPWGNNLGGSITGGQSGYDGSSDAWLATKGAANGFLVQNITFNGSVVTYSFYAKAGSLNWVNLNYGTTNSFFDLANGLAGVTTAIDSTIEDVGGGWYRCSAVNNYNGLSSVRIYPADADNDTSGTSGSIYIQDAQLEQGLVARDYIETTTTAIYGGITDNVPRLDYQGSCPALLLEPQRTNLALTSEYAGGSGWFISSGYSVSHNAAISPEGLQNAFELTIPAVNGNTRAIINVTPSTEYTFSFYVKRGTATELKYSIFNLTNNSNIIAQTSYYSQTSATEWKRIEVTFTTPAGCTSAGVYIDRDSQGDGTAFFYGIQCEQGSYATSYIPTYGSAVTRGLDSCYVNGISDIIGQSQGTLYFDIDYKDNGSDYVAIFLYDGTSANRLLVQRRANNDYLQSWATLSSSDLFNYTNQAVVSDGNHKIALAYAQDDFQTYLDGSSAGSDSSGSTYTNQLTNINLNPNNTLVRINQLMLFKTRLSNEELATLTTI